MNKHYDSNGVEHDNSLDAHYYSQLSSEQQFEKGCETGMYEEKYRMHELFDNWLTSQEFYKGFYEAEFDPEDERMQAFFNAMQLAQYYIR